MRSNYIDFISAYCDRWCERCGFTSRCSLYAVQLATEMCDGDFRQGLELAVGRPRPVERVAPPSIPDGAPDGPPTPTAEELKALQKSEDEGDARVQRSAIMEHAFAIATVSHRWLRARGERLREGSDDVVKEALAVAGWDATFVAPK